MGHLPIYFFAVADLPPGDGFPQAVTAGRGENRALVMVRRCQGMGQVKSLPGAGTI
jgi:hypothetical protein